MTVRRARALRQQQTDAERAFWFAVRDRRFLELKFRRQVPVGRFIADFVCEEKKLIVEIDGGQHDPKTDAERTYFFERRGYRVVRYWNNDVLSNIDGVLLDLTEQIQG